MRTHYKVFVAAALGLAVVNTMMAGATAAPQSSPGIAEKAFNAATKQSWSEAAHYAGQANDPLTVKIIEWLQYQQTDIDTRFSAISAFIQANPNWPRLSQLRRNAESAIVSGDDANTVNDWFERYPPLSGAGALAHLDALTAVGKVSKARALVPHYWQDRDFRSGDDKEFKRKYGKHLSNADHVKRLDRLIWEGQYGSAQRMLAWVEAPQAALGRARLSLMRREAGVDGAIARVPAALKDDPGLQYERLRWRRRKGMEQSARELLISTPPMAANAEEWAVERLILVRQALVDGHYSEAKRIIASHNLTEGASFAEAEFLAGWISLAFLKEPDAAYTHFTKLYEGVGYPISRARGAFWAGQAAAAADDKENAQRWWNVAAAFPATFYGQQAIAALGKTELRITFAAAQDSAAALSGFEPELVQAVRLLHRNDQTPLIVPFLRQLTDLSNTLETRLAIVDLANEVGLPHEAIRTAKNAAQLDNVIPAKSYPFLPFDDTNGSSAKQQREAPLVLSLIRQESAFNPQAVSRVGARGLMQLMPATAKRVAQTAGTSYSGARLLDDPRYNIQLGTAYLDAMLARFGDSRALALAAYNAGPSRVDRWIREMGDPRTGEISLIDWIESIPFGETRNYVQRVLETETVYRELLLNEQIAAMPEPPTDTSPKDKRP